MPSISKRKLLEGKPVLEERHIFKRSSKKDIECFTCFLLGECLDPKGCNEIELKQLTLF